MWKLKNLLLDVLALAAVKVFLGGIYTKGTVLFVYIVLVLIL